MDPHKEIIRSTVDPLSRTINLKRATWDIHILKHQELEQSLDGVMNLFSQPNYIVSDEEEDVRQVYISPLYLASKDKIALAVGVVEFDGVACSGSGDIVTAYVISRGISLRGRSLVYSQSGGGPHESEL